MESVDEWREAVRVSPVQSHVARGSHLAAVPAVAGDPRDVAACADRGVRGRVVVRCASHPYRGCRLGCGTRRDAGRRILAGGMDPAPARSGNRRANLLFAGATVEGICRGLLGAGAGGRFRTRRVEAASTLCADRWGHPSVPWTALENPGRPHRPGGYLHAGQSTRRCSRRVENSQRASRGVEICWPPHLSGHTFLRLFLQPDSGLFEFAAYAACGGRSSIGGRRLDVGDPEATTRIGLGWRDLYGRLCGNGKHLDTDGNDHGRAARVSPFSGILSARGAELDLAACLGSAWIPLK